MGADERAPDNVDLTHSFLLSMPQLKDGEFGDSLVYLLDHSEVGAFGVIINQRMGMALGEVFEQLDIADADPAIAETGVLCGGPVDQEHGLVLHPPGPHFDNTRDFDGGVSLSSSRDVLEALAAGDAPHQHLVLLGHAGWAPGQLENEIGANAWLTCDADIDVIFNVPAAYRRDAAGELLGIDLHRISSETGHA